MVQRRDLDAGIAGDYSCHSFRATGTTSHLANGNLEKGQCIAGHADSRTTKIYDRRSQKTTQKDIERISYWSALCLLSIISIIWSISNPIT